MPTKYDGTGVKPMDFTPIPEGNYHLKIIGVEETHSKSNDYQVIVTFAVDEKDFSGKQIGNHRVTFMPKGASGAGIALHFLKCLGLPHEGKFVINPSDWVGAVIKGDVIIDTYNGNRSNKVKSVQPGPVQAKETKVDPRELEGEAAPDDEVPF